METETIKNAFMDMLPKAPAEIKAMFIPTAAISPDAIDVLPECLNDLVKCGIKREQISVYDLHHKFPGNIYDSYDVIYICGGDPNYLMKRINEHGFHQQLLEYINHGGIVVGVSAGSMIFANDMPDNLSLLTCALDVHCSMETCEQTGHYGRNRQERIRLGNTQAILFDNDNIMIIE